MAWGGGALPNALFRAGSGQTISQNKIYIQDQARRLPLAPKPVFGKTAKMPASKLTGNQQKDSYLTQLVFLCR
jgi:hypothetical protein